MSYIAEQHVIGSLLMDFENTMPKICNILNAKMFKSELLGRIYTEFQRGYDNNYDVNVAVIDQRVKCEQYTSQMIMQEIKSCMSETMTSADVVSYAEVMESDYLTDTATQMISTIKFTSSDVKGQIGTLLNSLESLVDVKKFNMKSLAQIVDEQKGKYPIQNTDNLLNIGFEKLDETLGGLEGGDMIVIGARPAVGKSALVTQITTNLARQGKRIGFYNLEMQEKQVYERFVASQSGIGLTRLRRALKFNADEQRRFNDANEVLANQENIILTTGSKSMSEIRAEVKHMDYDIIIIDYLQLLKSDKTYKGNRTAEVGAISKAIKGLAMELNIPIIALSQMNRVSEMKETKEPTMSELREAGDIEQDASVIILMWNLLDDDKSVKGIKIEKNRQGITGRFVLNFVGDLMKFEESAQTFDNIKAIGATKRKTTPFDSKPNEFVQVENTPFDF